MVIPFKYTLPMCLLFSPLYHNYVKYHIHMSFWHPYAQHLFILYSILLLIPLPSNTFICIFYLICYTIFTVNIRWSIWDYFSKLTDPFSIEYWAEIMSFYSCTRGYWNFFTTPIQNPLLTALISSTIFLRDQEHKWHGQQ